MPVQSEKLKTVAVYRIQACHGSSGMAGKERRDDTLPVQLRLLQLADLCWGLQPCLRKHISSKALGQVQT